MGQSPGEAMGRPPRKGLGGEMKTPDADQVTHLSQQENARQPVLGTQVGQGCFSQVCPELVVWVGVSEGYGGRAGSLPAGTHSKGIKWERRQVKNLVKQRRRSLLPTRLKKQNKWERNWHPLPPPPGTQPLHVANVKQMMFE